jgi:hypothetical protein
MSTATTLPCTDAQVVVLRVQVGDLREVRQVMGDDPFAYGVRANQKAIDFIQEISVEQGLTRVKQPLNELFPEVVITAEERL